MFAARNGGNWANKVQKLIKQLHACEEKGFELNHLTKIEIN